jgi:tetratricopeptide (TPR) repeat protein
VQHQLDADLPEASFDQLAAKIIAGQRQPARTVAVGSGWGALEQERRRLHREPVLIGPEMPFERGDNSDSWEALLESGAMPDWPEPRDYMIDLRWEERLRLAADKGGWLPRLHLGVMMFAAGRFDEAERAWKHCLEAEENGWALRNLAVLAKIAGRDDAIDVWTRAQKLLPDDPHLVDELCRELLAAGRFPQLTDFVETLRDPLAARPRVRLARAVLAMATGDAPGARAYFDQPFDLVDIRENERTVTELWNQICNALPGAGDPAKPPADYDFRMHA